MATEEEVSELVEAVKVVEAKLELIDADWKKWTKVHKRLTEEDIPVAMQELKFVSLEREDFKVTIADKWVAEIPKYKRDQVATYVENVLNLPALVTRSIVQKFKPDEQEYYDNAAKALDEAQQPYETSRDVNTGSLKKAVKELMEKGEHVDLDKVCITKNQFAKIKRKD